MAPIYLELDVYYPENFPYSERFYSCFKLLESRSPRELPERVKKIADALDDIEKGYGKLFSDLHESTIDFLWAHQVFKYSDQHHSFDFHNSNGEEFANKFALLLLRFGANKIKAKANSEYYVNEDGRRVTAKLELTSKDKGKDPRDITWDY